MPDDENVNTHFTPKDNDIDLICITHPVFLKYVFDGIVQSGMLTIEFEYSASLGSLNYLEVEYSDPIMKKYVEGNPNVMRNIDLHLRNNLLYQEYNIK